MNSGAKRNEGMRDMQTLDARKDANGDALAAAGAVPAAAALGVPAAAVDMRQARAGSTEGDRGAAAVVEGLTVTLPFPNSDLMPNRRLGKHWSQSNTAKNKAFEDAYILTHQAMQGYRGPWHPTNGRVPVVLTFCAPDRRQRDLDNLLAASKSALDGVAAALRMDDREFEPVTLKRGEVGKPGHLVVVIGGSA
jgi:crossover junction endodeoxyribonuclease RusA